MTFLKKLISSFCILAILHSSLWSATAPIEYDALTRTARIRAVLDADKHAELVGHIMGGSIHNLVNYGNVTLPSHVFGQLKTFQNYGDGVAAIEVTEDSLTLPTITHNEGLLRIRSSENLHIHAHTLFNHGEINCIDGRPEGGEDPLRWYLHLESIQNKGAILADVSLIVGDLGRTIEELEGVLVGQNITLTNVTHFKAFVYAGYGVPELSKKEGNGNFSYIYEEGEDTPAPDLVEGSIFATGLADFIYPNAEDVAIAAFLNVGGMCVRMTSEESGQLFLERDLLNAPALESDALGTLKTLLNNSSLKYISDLWPNLLFATDAPSYIGPQGITILFTGAEKGDIFISNDYTIEGPIETHNVGEFQVLDTATVLYQNDVTLNAEELVVGGTFALGDNPLTKSPQFTTSARLYVAETGAFNAHRFVYEGTADTVHTNLGNVSINILDQTNPLYLENFGYTNVSRVRGTNTILHLRNNHGYVTTTAPLFLRYTKEGLEGLNEEAPAIDGYAETSNPSGMQVLLEEQTKFPTLFWNQSVKSLGPLFFKGQNTVHFTESSNLESARRVRLGGPGGRILNGTIKTPNLVLEGKYVVGSGLLDAPSIIVKTDTLDTSHFRFGETFNTLQITCDKKLVLGGGNSAEGFRLENKLLLSGKGTLSIRSPIQATHGVFGLLTGNSTQSLRLSTPQITSSHGPVYLVTPAIGFHERTPQSIEGSQVFIQADHALGADSLRLRDSLKIRSPGEAGSIRVKVNDSLKMEASLQAKNIHLGTGKNLSLNTRQSHWKRLTLDVPNGRTDLITGVRADGLTVHTQTFVPTAAIHVAEAIIESEFVSLDDISIEADWAHIDAIGLRSHGTTLHGAFAFEGGAHGFRDLDASKADVDFGADGTTFLGDIRLKYTHVTSKTVLMKGDVRAESITGLEDAQHFSLFGKLITQQKELRIRAQKISAKGEIAREDGTRFGVVELSGDEGDIHTTLATERLFMDFKGLDASESHLTATQSVLRAQQKLTAYHLFLDAMDSVLAADSISVTSSRLEGGDHVITTAKEAREATDAATATSLSHDAPTLTGDVSLPGTTVESHSLGLHAGTATLEPTSIHTGKTHVGLQTFDPVGGKSGVQAAVALGHALTGSERATIDARRVPEILRIDGHDRWRPNLIMEVADFAMSAGASLRSDGDLGVVSETNLQAIRAQIEARNLLLEARQGTIDLVASQVRATEDLKLKAGLDIRLTSLSERTGGGDNYTDHKVAAGAGAGGALSMEAGQHIVMTSVDTHSGTGTTLQAGGRILDLALDLVTQRTHHHRRGYTRDKWTHRATSSHTSGGAFVSHAGDTQELFAPRIQAKKVSIWGEEGANIYDVHDEHEHESHYKKKGGLFSSSKEVHTKSHTATSRGAHITADETVYIGSRKDVNLTNIHVVVPKTTLESVEGSVRLLLGTNYHSSFTTVKRSNVLWQGQGYNLEEHKTFSEGSFSGDVEVKAKELLVQQVQERTLEFLSRVRVVDGKLTFEFLEEFHKSESDYKDGPTAALAAVVAIAVTIATAGAASSLGLQAAVAAGEATAGAAATATAAAVAPTFTTAGAMISGMASGAFTSLCTQSALALLSAKGDIGQALKTLCTPNTLKSIAFSAVTAAATSGVAGAYDIEMAPSKIDSFSGHLQAQGLQAAVGAGMGMIAGERPESALLGGLKSAIAGAITASLAREIGKAYTPDVDAARAIDPISHKFFHALVGGLGGAITGDDPGKGAVAGAMGAFVAETMADMFAPEKPTFEKIKEEESRRGRTLTPAEFKDFYDEEMKNYGKALDRVEDFSKISAAMAAMLTYQDVNTAARAATNALDNNFLVLAWYGVMACSVAYDAYKIYKTFEEKGMEEGLKELGISVGVNILGGVGGRLLIKIKGVDKAFSSVGEAISFTLDKIPGAKTVLGKWVDKILYQAKLFETTTAAGQKLAKAERYILKQEAKIAEKFGFGTGQKLSSKGLVVSEERGVELTLRFKEGMNVRDFHRKANALQDLAERGKLHKSIATRSPVEQAAYRRRLLDTAEHKWQISNPDRFERFKISFRKMDADHLHELQLGGWDDSTALWMLDSAVNRSFGAQIQRQLKDLDIGVKITKIIVEGPKL